MSSHLPEVAAPGAAPGALDLDVVAFGGGHGLSASLAALRRVVNELTAVVTVADNGGSSGRLRSEFDVLPPGDLRMALAALCGDDDWGQTWARVVQHRFDGTGDMQGHVVGNLLIIGLWELLGDAVPALDWMCRLLGAQGRVLPMSLTPMDITARVRGLRPEDPTAEDLVRGQVEVATTEGDLVGIELDPDDPEACPEAVAAVEQADWLVLGPGSWYTSVIPHLMVPDLRKAIVSGRAKVLVVMNLEAQAGEAQGLSPEGHLHALLDHAPDLQVHTVLADPTRVPDTDDLARAVERIGARLELAEVGALDGRPQHDPERLAAAYQRILGRTD